MQRDQRDLKAISSGLAYTYTRQQALVDGVLNDVTETGREAGFKVPLALTAEVWRSAVAWTDADSVRQIPQDQAGRLWDLLWMAHVAARMATSTQRTAFNFMSCRAMARRYSRP